MNKIILLIVLKQVSGSMVRRDHWGDELVFSGEWMMQNLSAVWKFDTPIMEPSYKKLKCTLKCIQETKLLKEDGIREMCMTKIIKDLQSGGFENEGEWIIIKLPPETILKPTFCSWVEERLKKELSPEGITVKGVKSDWVSVYEYEGEMGSWGREIEHLYIKLLLHL